MPGRTKSLRKARVRWFSDKPKRKRKGRRSTPRQGTAFRMRDICKILRRTYGHVLPDDDAGRDDLYVAINHLACLPHPQKRIDNFIEIWAPWLSVGESKQITASAIISPEYWTADELAWRMGLTAAVRAELGITTIGAIDENRSARLKRRQTSAKERLRTYRRAKGAKRRAEYLAQFAGDKPWEVEGISRRTWFRRRAKLALALGPNAP